MAKTKPLPRHRVKFRYRPQFGLIVVCRDEPGQRRVYRRLRKLGYEPRVVTV